MQYYKPWELREDEEEQIKQQIDKVEVIIKQDLAKHDSTESADTEMTEVHPPVSETLPSNTEPDEQIQKLDGDMELVGADQPKSDTDKQDDTSRATTTTDEGISTSDPIAEEDQPTVPDEKPHDEHGGEELVEGQEDDVIY